MVRLMIALVAAVVATSVLWVYALTANPHPAMLILALLAAFGGLPGLGCWLGAECDKLDARDPRPR